VNRQLRRMRHISPALGILAATLLYAGVTSTAAAPTSSIEGVWSFNGGQVGVHRLSNGAYVGTVVSATKFAQCVHPVGQQIWSNMTEQPDGSFDGLHQWYLANCEENPTLGPTAWRVLQATSGARYLRVCFSDPGTSQPTIAPSGAPNGPSEYAAHHVTYGCDNSELIAPLPLAPGTPGAGRRGVSGSVESLTLPSKKLCLRGRRFAIRLKEPQYDPFKTVTITFKGHEVATSREGEYIVATIRLRRSKQRFTIRIDATTVLGHRLSTRRTYHRCHKRKRRRRHMRSHKKG
jgi:hypothetical protein